MEVVTGRLWWRVGVKALERKIEILSVKFKGFFFFNDVHSS
jgi:hypothetical protein